MSSHGGTPPEVRVTDAEPVPGADYSIGIPGNLDVRHRLDRLALDGHLHPCLLFEGAGGLGKAAAARWLAMRLNCEAWPDGGPCRTCWSCRQIDKGTHPDVIQVGLDPQRKTPIISVSQARELLGQLAMRPYNARSRVVIIDPADALTVESGNALLKTLEEPPPDTRFVLVTSRPRALLITILSRCQRVRFGAVDPKTVAAWLEERGVDDALWLAQLAEGCPRAALDLVDGEAAAWKDARDAILHSIGGGLDDVFSYAEALTKGDRGQWRIKVDRSLDAVERLLQDAWRLRTRGEPARYNPDREAVVEAWSHALDAQGLCRMTEALDLARSNLSANVSGRLVLEALVARMATELGAARTAGRR